MEKYMTGYSGTPLSHSSVKLVPSVFIGCVECSCRSCFPRRTCKCNDRNNVSSCSVFRVDRHTAFLFVDTDLIAGLFADNTSDILLQLAVHIIKLVTAFIEPSVLSFFIAFICTTRCRKIFGNNRNLNCFHPPT